MNSVTTFILIWIIGAVGVLTTLYKRGKKALAIFPDINNEHILYRDKSASGYSSKSWITKMGGASKSLDVVVTDKELWFKSMLLFASSSKQHDLLHKIPLTDITKIVREGKEVRVNFRTTEGECKEMIIFTKYPDDFLYAIRK